MLTGMVILHRSTFFAHLLPRVMTPILTHSHLAKSSFTELSRHSNMYVGAEILAPRQGIFHIISIHTVLQMYSGVQITPSSGI